MPRRAEGKSEVPGRADPTTFHLVSCPGHPGLPFPLLSLPERSAGHCTKRETPVGGGREVGTQAVAHPKATVTFLPERPHWHSVVGLGWAGGAPGQHRAVSCGEWRVSPGPVPGPAAPIPPGIHTPSAPQPQQLPPHARGPPRRLHL